MYLSPAAVNGSLIPKTFLVEIFPYLTQSQNLRKRYRLDSVTN